MGNFFFDSSSLVKRYARETGTSWIISLLKPSRGNTVFVAKITSVEVVAGLARQMRMRKISLQELNKAVARFERTLSSRYAFV